MIGVGSQPLVQRFRSGLGAGGGVRLYLSMISGSQDGSANSSPYRSAISSLASAGGGPDVILISAAK